MRIYWPTTVNLPPEGGIAIGWRGGSEGEVLRVAAVVPAWVSCDESFLQIPDNQRNEFDLMSSDFTTLARVKDVSSLLSADDSERGSGLTIYLENNLPAALSEPPQGRVCVVIYTPASSVADLLISPTLETEVEGHSPPEDDVMEVVSPGFSTALT